MCSFLLRSVGGEVGGWAVREAEPAHTDYTGKRNNVSSSNWQYLAHKKKSISPKSISPCLSTFLPSCERYGAVCILVRWFSPTEKLHCFISCWYLPTNGGGNLQGTNRSLGIRPPRHYILSLIKHRGFSVCVFAQVVCVCVCPGYVLPRQSCRKKVCVLFNKAMQGEYSSDSAGVCLLLLKTQNLF